IVKYVNQLSNKEIRILIPGCGYGYEAEYLFNNGFKNVFVLDYSEIALLEFKKRVPQFPKSNLIETDFFKHNKSYDLIIEQTFFCALNPNLRKDYVLHCSSLLNKNGKLIGLLFNDDLNETHPPFGGNKTEYELIFSTHFNLNIIDNCYNSIEPRKGKELFINLSKK
ncbi:MAG: methyltransferase domain-containing protein, partial [Vicingaceae bacterium]|nr:methyltransferase domain-containing protein [Vicingaceae bacterium]